MIPETSSPWWQNRSTAVGTSGGSHLDLQVGGQESKTGVVPSETSKPFLSETPPPTKPPFQTFQNSSSDRDQVFKYRNL